jgi:hypothetical protein
VAFAQSIRARKRETAGMDALSEFLNDQHRKGTAQGNFLGLLHILVGRRLESPDGTLLSNGLTWRELAALLKKVHWPREAVQELGLQEDALPPRDRVRYWYSAIAQARVDSDKAREEGDRVAELLRKAGFRVGPAPGAAKD